VTILKNLDTRKAEFIATKIESLGGKSKIEADAPIIIQNNDEIREETPPPESKFNIYIDEINSEFSKHNIAKHLKKIINKDYISIKQELLKKLPARLPGNYSYEEAERIKSQLEEFGSTVSIQEVKGSPIRIREYGRHFTKRNFGIGIGILAFLVIAIFGLTRSKNGKSLVALIGDNFQKPCSIRGNVTWEYNEFVGIKGDVGAKVILMRRFKEKIPLGYYIDYETDKTKGVYVTQVNTLGQYQLTDIVPGTYDLLVISESTNRNVSLKFDPHVDYWNAYIRLHQQILQQTDLSKMLAMGIYSVELGNFIQLQKNILRPHFMEEDYEKVVLSVLGTNKYEVEGEIKLVPGDVIEVNVDFGNTYI